MPIGQATWRLSMESPPTSTSTSACLKSARDDPARSLVVDELRAPTRPRKSTSCARGKCSRASDWAHGESPNDNRKSSTRCAIRSSASRHDLGNISMRREPQIESDWAHGGGLPGDGWSVNKQTSSCNDNHGASSGCGELRIGAGAEPRRPSTVEQSRAGGIVPDVDKRLQV